MSDKIKKSDVQEICELNPMQTGMLFQHLRNPSENLYSVQIAFEIKGEFDSLVFEKALYCVQSNNEALRSVFRWEKLKKPLQIILNKCAIDYSFINLTEPHGLSNTSRIRQVLADDVEKGFDLSKLPFRVSIIESAKDSRLLVLTHHHILYDGWSTGILVSEILGAYRVIKKGSDIKFSPKPDYASVQKMVIPTLSSEDRKYWLNYLKGYEIMPTISKSIRKISGANEVRRFGFTLKSKKIKSFAAKNRITQAALVYTAFGILIQKYLEKPDVVFGVTLSNRNAPITGIENVVGNFINTIPLRITASRKTSFLDLAIDVNNDLFSKHEQSNMPYSEIKEMLKLSPEQDLFDAIVVGLNYPLDEGMNDQNPEFDLSLHSEHETTEFPLMLDVTFEPNLKICITYHEGNLGYNQIKLFKESFNEIINAILLNPKGYISETSFSCSNDRLVALIESDLLEQPSADKVNDLIPVSHQQYKIWSNSNYFDNDRRYLSNYNNVYQIIEFKGNLDPSIVEHSIQLLINKYSILRTKVVEKDQKPFQKIYETLKFILVREIAEPSMVENQSLILREARKPFKLSEIPIRGTFLKLADNMSKLVLVSHNTILDRFSLNRLSDEIISVYEKLKSDKDVKLDECRIQYSEFSKWEQDGLPKFNPIFISYWRPLLADGPLTFNLPTQKVLKDRSNYSKASKEFSIPSNLASLSTKYSESRGFGPDVLYMAVFKILLYKYSQQEDILIGIGRGLNIGSMFDKILGPALGVIPILSKIKSNFTFSEYIDKLNKDNLEAQKYSTVPFEMLSKELSFGNMNQDKPIFNVVFTYEDCASEYVKNGDLELRKYTPFTDSGTHDLSVVVRGSNREVSGEVIFNSDYFSSSTIERFAPHFLKILSSVVDNPDILISDIKIITTKEKKQILSQFSTGKKETISTKTFSEAFEEQALLRPENIAVVHNDQEMTYYELNQKSSDLASYLQHRGLCQNKNVVLYLPRTIDMLVSILATFKAGGAYVPIDMDMPSKRVEQMLEDSQPAIIITMQSSIEGLSEIRGYKYYREKIVSLDQIQSFESIWEVNHSKNDLAYIIYTSGTTGIPKGAMVHQFGLMNHMYAFIDMLEMGENDVMAQTASPSFDISVWQFLIALLVGGTTCIVDKEIVLSPGLLFKELIKKNVSIFQTVPSLLTIFLDQFKESEDHSLPRLRKMISTAESLNISLIKQWYSFYPNIPLFNVYGPAEASDDVTSYLIESVEDGQVYVPIGKPLQNNHVYIMDGSLNLCPIGVIGEICISGIQVGLGYWNRKERTQKSFIRNPLADTIKDADFERLYRTGDLGYIQEDGNMVFIGRGDDQIKIRGLRIELGEINTTLISYKDISDAIVVLTKSDMDKYLVAYYVSKGEIEPEKLRDYLSEHLPEYMLPSFYVHIEEMPLTPNFKIDKKSLPVPELKSGNRYIAPSSAIEFALVDIWSKVLDLKNQNIGVNENFFNIGGHSLKAINLVNQISKKFDIQIALSLVFDKPTINLLAKYIGNATENPKGPQEKYEKIKKVGKSSFYPMSSAQKRLFFLYRFSEDSIAYNMPLMLDAKGKLDLSKLKSVFQKLVDRHENLRTYFEIIDDEPVQKIAEPLQLKIEVFDSKKSPESVMKNFIRPFDMGKAPLIRIGLIRISDYEHIILIDLHHIISDGVSNALLVSDLKSIYNGDVLPPLPIQYKDYALWQEKRSIEKEFKKEREFWLEIFDKEPTVLDLPYDFQRPLISDFEGATWSFKIDKAQLTELKSIARDSGATMYMILLSIYNIFLSKLTGQEDIIIGTPIAGRNHPDLENIIGLFVNTLALRNYPRANCTFLEFLEDVKERTLAYLENQSYEYELLIEDLKIPRDTGRNPLFDVMFSYENFDEMNFDLHDLNLKPRHHSYSISKFDLTLTVQETGTEGLLLDFEYATSIFKKETIKRFASYFKQIIDSILTNQNALISSFEIITPKEKQQILFEFNDTFREIDRVKTFSQVFREQVLKNENKISVRHNDSSLTYSELYKKSCALSHVLREKGVGPNTNVALFLPRNIGMLTSILATFNAGGAYIPIDINLPPGRVNQILKDSDAAVILTLQEKQDVLKEIKGVTGQFDEIVFLDGIDLDSIPEAEFEAQNGMEDLAYIIYTSGSTGTPKGAMIHQLGMMNHIYGLIEILDLKNDDVVAQTASCGFDISVWQFLAALLVGGTVQIIDKDVILDPKFLLQALRKNKVSIFQSVPSLLTNFLKEFYTVEDHSLADLRWMIPTGESLNKALVIQWYSYYPNIRLLNAYGPAEASDDSTVHIVEYPRDNEIHIPIGKPIQNIHVYVLDAHLKMCPVGIKGEICVSGIGVGKGYWKDSQKTKKSFITNPFYSELDNGDYKKLYKTGDFGYYLPNGSLVCLGRGDDQVKIRGARIELGEVEYAFSLYEPIEDVVVVPIMTNGDKSLAAYYVGSKPININELKGSLLKSLPDHMLPAYYMELEKLPLNNNGKIDKKSLPRPKVEISENFVEPANEIEETLVGIWSKVLNLNCENISTNSSFFALGGHSLKAVGLANHILKELNFQIPLVQIFKCKTIVDLARYIQRSDNELFEGIKPTKEKSYYALSSAQERLYFIDRLETSELGYNMPLMLEVNGEFNATRLRNAFDRLIDRHEILRTSFELIDGIPHQKVHKAIKFELEYYKSFGDENKVIKHFIRPFVLSEAPLLRAGVLWLGANHHILMIDLHHIITDGISNSQLVDDFLTIYSGDELPKLELQYKDYVAWQNSNRYKNLLRKQERYWLEEFETRPPRLELPLDFVRPPAKTYEGNVLNFDLTRNESKGIRKIVEQEETTSFMLFLSVFSILLSKLSKQEDIVIGTPTSGRPHADLESIIGMFVNTLPIRTYPFGHLAFAEFLSEVKRITLNGFENQSYEYQQLIENLSLTRELNRNPLFDVLFAYENFDERQLRIPNLKMQTYDSGHVQAQFDITLRIVEEDDKFLASFEYATDLFNDTTIKRFAYYFKKVLTDILENPRIKLSEIDIVSVAEKKMLVYDFNTTTVDYPKEESIISLFKKQAARTPNHTAVKFGGNLMSYAELDYSSDQIAYYLVKYRSVYPGELVGIMLDRELDMIPYIYGILKAGAAYVPIDRNFPKDRVSSIVKSANLDLIITRNNPFKNDGIKVSNFVDLQEEQSFISDLEPNWEPLSIKGKDLAYVIFTSGSTGVPKGVMIEHHSVLNRILWMQKKYPINGNDVLLQKTPITFDVSVWELFWWSFTGASLFVLAPEEEKNPETISRIIKDETISVVHFVPSMLNAFLAFMKKQGKVDSMNTLRFVFASGEVLKPKHVGLFKELLGESGCRLINLYGPTEATVDVSFYECDLEKEYDEVPIGKAIDNTQLLILDENGQLAPLGTVGELAIAGVGLARGYLNMKELTDAKYIVPAFGFFERIYLSGDLARWLPNGNIGFLGRKDRQVKIRGYRIELGDIEAQLLKHPKISDAVALVKNWSGEPCIVGYYVVNEHIEEIKLRKFLLNKIPSYMVPSFFVRIEKVPVTRNGKLDRKALPAPLVESNYQYSSPANKTEQELSEIWSDILDLPVNSISTDKSFFELGGHSIKAIRLINAISERLNINLEVRRIFEFTSIMTLGSYLDSLDYKKGSIPRLRDNQFYKASPAQERLYYQQLLDGDNLAYNNTGVLRIGKTVSIERLRSSLKKLILRHEALRTSFILTEESVLQKINPISAIDFRLPILDENDYDGVEEALEHFIRPFELSEKSLFRTTVLRGTKKHDFLFFDIHHIVCDGISYSILARDFEKIYHGRDLEPLKVRYIDFASWQWNLNDQLDIQRHYWQEKLSGEIPFLDLPVVKERPLKVFNKSSIKKFSINGELLNEMKNFSSSANVSNFMFLLSVYYILLYKLTGNKNIIVGTDVAGRSQTYLKNVVGTFVNIVPIRIDVDPNDGYLSFLNRVKRTVIDAFKNQDFPFNEMVAMVNRDDSMNINPLVQVHFSFADFSETDEKLTAMDFEPLNFGEEESSQYEISIKAFESDDEVTISLIHFNELFEDKFIETMLEYFESILTSLVKNENCLVKDIKLENTLLEVEGSFLLTS